MICPWIIALSRAVLATSHTAGSLSIIHMSGTPPKLWRAAPLSPRNASGSTSPTTRHRLFSVPKQSHDVRPSKQGFCTQYQTTTCATFTCWISFRHRYCRAPLKHFARWKAHASADPPSTHNRKFRLSSAEPVKIFLSEPFHGTYSTRKFWVSSRVYGSENHLPKTYLMSTACTAEKWTKWQVHVGSR